MTTTSAIQPMERPKLSVKAQTMAAIVAIMAAVVVPQIFHVVGSVTGMGTALGETFLPMHLPILLVGLLAGPYAGLAAGAFGPVASYALTGMPGLAMLPFMILELSIYGLSAGLLRNVKMPTIAKVAVSQIAGRAVRAVAILLSVYGFGVTGVKTAVIWKSIQTGLFGLILQWAFIPLIMFWVENRKQHEK